MFSFKSPIVCGNPETTAVGVDRNFHVGSYLEVEFTTDCLDVSEAIDEVNESLDVDRMVCVDSDYELSDLLKASGLMLWYSNHHASQCTNIPSSHESGNWAITPVDVQADVARFIGYHEKDIEKIRSHKSVKEVRVKWGVIMYCS